MKTLEPWLDLKNIYDFEGIFPLKWSFKGFWKIEKMLVGHKDEVDIIDDSSQGQ